MRKVTFMNVPFITSVGTFKCTEITVEMAKKLCSRADQIDSAVGHSGAAEAIENLLQVDCPVNRIEYSQQVGEDAIVLKLLARMPEGCGNITFETMKEIGFKLFRLQRLA